MPRTSAWLLAALSAGFFAPGILRGDVPIFRDLLVLVIPLRSVARSAVRAGVLPLWTDDLFFGAPFLANYQSAVLYPPSILIYALPFALGLSTFLAFHLFVAAWGMARYLERRCGLGTSTSAFGGLVFSFGGFFTSLVPLTNQLEVAAWLPWVLEAGEELQETGSLRWFLRLTVLVCLQALGGAPEPMLLTAVVLTARVVVTLRRAPSSWTRLPAIAASFALAIAIAAAQLLPTAEYAIQTERAAGLSLERVTAESLQPSSLLQLLIPHSFSGTTPSFVPEGRIPIFWSIYLGVAPLVLAFLALARDPLTFWAPVLVLSIAFSLGVHSPVFLAIHNAAPWLVGAFRFPGKFFLAAHFSLALLAASGLDRVIREPEARRTAALGFGVVTAVSAALGGAAWIAPEATLRAVGYEFPPSFSNGAYEVLAAGFTLTAVRSAMFAALGLGILRALQQTRLSERLLLVGLVTFSGSDLFLIHRATPVFSDWNALRKTPVVEARPGERLFHYCTRSPGCLVQGAPGIGPWSGVLRPGEDVVERGRSLWSALVPDLPMIYGFGAVAGSDGFSTRSQEEFFRALALLPRDRAIHLLASLGVSQLIGDEPLPEAAADRQPIRAGPDVWQYELREHAPRLYLARRALFESTPAAALERASAPDFRPGVDAVVLTDQEKVPSDSRDGEITSVMLSPGQLSATVSLAQAGLLVISDTWLPGWSATLDGAPITIERVNGILRGLQVPAGTHRLEMLYAPWSFRAGCWVSTAAAFLLLALGAYALGRRPGAGPG